MKSLGDDQLEVLRSVVREDFSAADRAHDIDHIERVERMAARLARDEGGDVAVARAAALVHDYHRLDGEHGLGTTGAGGYAATQQALKACGADEEAMSAIVDCIAFTDRYAIAGDDTIAASIEAAVVRDADNLDAMGAIGIARAFSFGATLNEPLWNPSEKVGDGYDRGHAPSVLHHFYEKLLHLQDELTTAAAQAIGATRHLELERFVKSFRAEWEAER